MMERIDLESKTDIKNFQQGNAKLENSRHELRFLYLYRIKITNALNIHLLFEQV